MRLHSTHTRDSSLRKLSVLNRWLIAGSVTLTGVLTDVAAHAFPGKKSTAPATEHAPSSRSRQHAGKAGSTTTPAQPAGSLRRRRRARRPNPAPETDSRIRSPQTRLPGTRPAHEAAPEAAPEPAPAQEPALALEAFSSGRIRRILTRGLHRRAPSQSPSAPWQALGCTVVLQLHRRPGACNGAQKSHRELAAIDRPAAAFVRTRALGSTRAGGLLAVSRLCDRGTGGWPRAAELTGGDVDPTVGRALELAG